MVNRRSLKSIMFVAIAFLGSGLVFSSDCSADVPEVVPPNDQAAQRSIPWRVQEIEDDLGAFSYVSVAVSPLGQDLFISWYDIAGGDLWWARTVESGGNCGPGDTWLCEARATTGDVGKYNSIAVKQADGGGHDFVIAYYDATQEQLMYVGGTVDGLNLTSSTYVVDSGFNDPYDRTGMYTAAIYDPDGNPWIAYQNETYFNQIGTHWMIARWVGDGSGNCGEGPVAGDWDCGDLFSSGLSQSFSSSAITWDSWGRMAVAFYSEIWGQPLLAHRVGSGNGGNCGPSSEWKCYSVAPRPGDTDIGKHVVPFFADDSKTLFYQNVSRGELERAVYVAPASGNCGWSGSSLSFEWQCDSISNMDGIFLKRGLSVVTSMASYPIVAFQYGDDGPAGLGIARPTATPDVTSAGNCGPGNSWFCEVIDAGATLTEADSLSMTKNWLGETFIAYHELNDYPHPAQHNLKLARLPSSSIFIDSFESGNTSAWSGTVP